MREETNIPLLVDTWRKDDMLSYLVGLDGGSTEKGAEKLLGQVDKKWTGWYSSIFKKKSL